MKYDVINYQIKKVFSLSNLILLRMKKYAVILIMSIVVILSACNSSSKKEKKMTPEEAKAKLDSIRKILRSNRPVYDTAKLGNPDSLMQFPTVLKFEKELYDLGTIKEGEKIKHNIIYTNTGKYPLIIFSAIGSCGCTVPEYKKEPLAPGMSDTLSFTFNSEGKHGNHTKTISVLANTNPSSNQVKFSVKVK
jgi:hypothetical protein